MKKFGATALAGWGAGYAVLREIGPILIALMFSGRVGANNTAELATMTVTEQLDGLRALAIDPVRFLVVPRVVAMIVMLVALTVIGDLVALAGASSSARAMLDIEWSTMFHIFADNLKPYDFLHGVYKSIAFGGAIAMTSCYFGVTVRGGAVGVGKRGQRRGRRGRRLDHAARLLPHLHDRMSMAARHDRTASAAASSTSSARRSSCGSSTSARSPASARPARPAARPRGEIVRQMYAIGNRSLLFIVVTLGFIGMVMTYEACLQLIARHRRLLAGRQPVHQA